MPIPLSTFRAQSNFAGYQVTPAANAVWDPASLQLVIESLSSAGSIAPAFINTATTSITAGAYVQLVASLSAAADSVSVYNGSSTPVLLAVGAAAAEVDKILIFPGESALPLAIAQGARLSLKSVSGTISTGIVGINFIG